MHELPRKSSLLVAARRGGLDHVVLDLQILEQELDREIVVRLDPADLRRRQRPPPPGASPRKTAAPRRRPQVEFRARARDDLGVAGACSSRRIAPPASPRCPATKMVSVLVTRGRSTPRSRQPRCHCPLPAVRHSHLPPRSAYASLHARAVPPACPSSRPTSSTSAGNFRAAKAGASPPRRSTRWQTLARQLLRRLAQRLPRRRGRRPQGAARLGQSERLSPRPDPLPRRRDRRAAPRRTRGRTHPRRPAQRRRRSLRGHRPPRPLRRLDRQIRAALRHA